MKRKNQKLVHIIAIVCCQALGFCFINNPTSAISNEITISCPAEATVGIEVTCDISGKTASEINNIFATFSVSNLQIKNFTPSSNWTNDSTGTNTSISISTETPITSTFSIGKITLIPESTNQQSIIGFENIKFKNSENYHFNAASQAIEIKINSAPVTPTCASDEELIDGKCIKKIIACNEDEELIDGTCIKKPITCKDDEELINGECIKKTSTCAEDEELIEGECIKKSKQCKENEKLVDNECVSILPTCKTDEELIDGKCVKKSTTPTCNTDEELINGNCQKKKQNIDWMLIGIIAGGSILIIGIIIAIILVTKKAKKDVIDKNFISLSNTQGPSLATSQRMNMTYDNNGTYLARSKETTDANIDPTINTDANSPINTQNPQVESAISAQLANQITEDSAQDLYDDPRLQYNFSQNKPLPTSPLQPTQAIAQNPIMSSYNIATQVVENQTQPIEQITHETLPPEAVEQSKQKEQPVQTAEQPQSIQTPIYRPTNTVPLSDPTDPTVFES